MYITVKLLNGYTRALTYRIPQHITENITVGMLVRVPLQKRIERALVCDILATIDNNDFAVRDILAIEQMSFDTSYHAFIKQLSNYYGIHTSVLYRRIYQPDNITDSHLIENLNTEHAHTHVHLTPAQQLCVDGITPAIQSAQYEASLLYGVTGSGKTEVYAQLMQTAYLQKKTTLFLLPEVSLAVTFTALLQQRFKDYIKVYDYHSATRPQTKRDVWQALLAREPIIVVGVHVPILLPFNNLGLIIIDEEHDVGFQEKRQPRINTKEAALLRARCYNIPIVLGSATPSISSLNQVTHAEWRMYRLTERFAGSFPRITLASLIQRTKQFTDRDQYWITDQLHHAIQQRLHRNEQTIIFLNRRGLNKFVQCKDCAYIFSCPACSVSLTLHESNQLMCHYCAVQRHLPKHCPTCGVSDEKFLKKGIGTQRLVELLSKRFPQARIARADTDTVRQKRQWHETMTRMHDGEIDILVGTQTITKGYHFPRVTLVGIIWAESNLTIPFYNAAEMTLQQILQVAGRAGRASHKSDVIVQSFIEHPIFSYLNENEYMNFYEYEIGHRRELGYPPVLRMSEIFLQHENEQFLDNEAARCIHILRAIVTKEGWDVKILGPALPPVHRIQHQNMRKIYLKSARVSWHIALFHALQKEIRLQHCWFHPNPLQ